MASGTGQPRTYSIAADITGGTFKHEQMTAEIEAESAITSVLDYINRDGDTVDVYFTTTLSAPEITALDALFTNHVPATADRLFRFDEENGAQTTTLETYQNAISLTPANGLQKGVYRMSWTCELRITPTGALNSRVQTRFQIDGNTKSNTASVSEQWQCFSGWDRYFAKEGEKPALTLDYRRDPGVGGDDTVEIRKVRVGIEFMG